MPGLHARKIGQGQKIQQKIQNRYDQVEGYKIHDDSKMDALRKEGRF